MVRLQTLLMTGLCLVGLFAFCPTGRAEERVPLPADANRHQADSLMQKVIFFAPLYEHIVEDRKSVV